MEKKDKALSDADSNYTDLVKERKEQAKEIKKLQSQLKNQEVTWQFTYYFILFHDFLLSLICIQILKTDQTVSYYSIFNLVHITVYIYYKCKVS